MPKDSSGQTDGYQKYFFDIKEKYIKELKLEEDTLWNKTKFILFLAFDVIDAKPTFDDLVGIDPLDDFKKYVFGTPEVRNQILSKATNSANKNISQSVLEDLEFKFPKLEEQQKIGLFLSSIDHLITLHQRKCDALKNAKKFFLQNMFV